MWEVKLGTCNFNYFFRKSIKGQVVLDFLDYFLVEDLVLDIKKVDLPTQLEENDLPWELYVDGSNNVEGSRLYHVLISPEIESIEKSTWLDFSMSNNEAKYKDLIKDYKVL